MAATRKTPTKIGKPRRTQAYRERLGKILTDLHKLYPEVECALHHRNPYELLTATILSAQCTDETVNKVTPALFAHCPKPAMLAAASQPTVEKLIFSTGFYRNKTKNIRGMAKKLVDDHGGEVPSEMEQLLELPGVARKTANVLLGTAFGKPEGIVVDTHVGRIARRLDMARQKDPVKVERELCELLPQHDWIWFSHALIWHGRGVCDAKRPRCEVCTLADLCPGKE